MKKQEKFSLTDIKAANFVDRTGLKYGKLTCTDTFERRGKRIYWLCKCECGNEKWVCAQNLIKAKSCGCNNKTSHTIHGMSHTRIHDTWNHMISRCHNKNHRFYKYYGGRGIKVCEEWIGTEGFMRFYDWATKNGYQETLTLDRIDNNKGYSPENCRWVTQSVQNNNKRSNRNIEYNGEIHTIAEWARLYNIKYSTLQMRLTKRGWDIEKALTREVTPNGRTTY